MKIVHTHPHPRLADHVRACRVGKQMIFLDLLRDKYIGFGGAQVASLDAALLGQPSAGRAEASGDSQSLSTELLKNLRDHHLLSDTTAQTSAQRPLTFTEAIASLAVDDIDASDAPWGQLARLWMATFTASMWLRRFSLAEIANRIAALRRCQPCAVDGDSPGAIRGAVAAYFRLRPFALTSHDRCLHDSLTLILFLAGHAIYPRWVIGVRTHPFSAHSWVQQEGLVLNDMHERVRRFQPILIV